MARTKGAKDKTKRKILSQSPQRPATKPGLTAPPDRTQVPPAPSQASGPERLAIPPDDFKAAIAAELRRAESSETSKPGQGSSDSSPPAPGSAFDPAGLTLDGLANAWRLPFYVLARLLQWLQVAPDPEPIAAVGRRRAKELAKASYPIWDYYARQYVNVHPDQGVNVALGVTALDAIGIVPDLIDAIEESRRRFAPKGPLPDSGQPATPQGGGVPQ
ncbi:MAG: hypothetical protein MUC88_20450 [Planctomycetes bacterium]|jgi:hypothetical protein|nr:hypothetical protein [Planctomycetota bacterium]